MLVLSKGLLGGARIDFSDYIIRTLMLDLRPQSHDLKWVRVVIIATGGGGDLIIIN